MKIACFNEKILKIKKIHFIKKSKTPPQQKNPLIFA